MVGPGESSAEQWDLKDAKLIQSKVESVHEAEVKIVVVLVIREPNKVEIPNDNPRPGDQRKGG